MGQGQDPADQLGPVRSERDFQLGLLGQGPRRMGQGALEDFGRGFGGGHVQTVSARGLKRKGVRGRKRAGNESASRLFGATVFPDNLVRTPTCGMI